MEKKYNKEPFQNFCEANLDKIVSYKVLDKKGNCVVRNSGKPILIEGNWFIKGQTETYHVPEMNTKFHNGTWNLYYWIEDNEENAIKHIDAFN
jgi:hypothetical protein